MRLSLDTGLGSVAGMGGGAYVFTNAEAAALVARFTTPPTNARAALIDNLVGALKAVGVWSKLDAFYVLAAANNQAARRNWIADAFNLSAVSGPTFTTDRGYAGDGSGSYLESAFNATTAPSPKFLLNDASLFGWLRTNNSGQDIGNQRSRLFRGATTGQAACFPNNASQAAAASLVFPGFGAWARSASNLWEGYGNGADGGGGTDASTTLTNETLRICMATNVGFSTNQIAAAGWGSNLTAGENLALYNAVRTYLQAVGAA